MDDRILALLRRVLQKIEPNLSFSRVTEGSSSNVYKIINGTDTLFLRMPKDKDEMISPQILAHEQLAKKGIKVPRFVSWDDANATLGHSYMIVKAIPGLSLEALKAKNRGEYDSCLETVLEDAGEDIARTTHIPTSNYGWIKRDQKKARELIGEIDFYKDFLLDKISKKVKDLEAAGFETFTEDQLERYKMLVFKYIPEGRPNLCHGDFDLSHIYVSNGKYSGIIDWGDIRSASNVYDIAHFTAFHPDEAKFIMKGFQQIIRTDKDFDRKLVLTRLAICINKLWWTLKNNNRKFENHKFREAITNDISLLRTL